VFGDVVRLFDFLLNVLGIITVFYSKIFKNINPFVSPTAFAII